MVALKDKLPVRPLRSTDPTHGRRVLTRIWDRRGEKGELQQVGIKGTIYVNPNKRDASSLPYVVRYDDTDESDEEIYMECLGKDLFFTDNLQEVPAPPRAPERESREPSSGRQIADHTHR